MRPASVRRGAALALLLGLAGAPAQAAPDITGPEARAFLGGRTGKIVYLKNNLRQIHYIDFSDSMLVERKVSEDSYCLGPMIHPDGTRIVYETEGSVWIRYLEENSKERFLVYRGTPRNNMSLEPHWWIHPGTGEEYVTFSPADVSEAEWPPKAGPTYIQKIDPKTNLPSGPRQTLLPFSMSGGRSKNGMWGSTSHHTTGMYKMIPNKVADAFFASTNWQDSGALMACNASTSPSKDPARQDRMMHLTSGLVTVEGEAFDNHKAIVIRSWNDPSPDKPLWYMGIPGVRCNNDSSGNLFWEHPEWSTDEDYFTAVGSKIVIDYQEGDLYMGRINWTGDSRIRRVLKGGGINHLPHLWVQDSVRAAKLRITPAAIAFVSLKQDAEGPRPDTVRVVNDGDAPLPALSLGPLPAWLTVEILGNGTNSPRLVNRVDRSRASPGNHRATVSVTYGQGVDSAAYEVRFTYADPVLTSLQPLPRLAVATPGDSVRLTARGLDQTGAAFPGLPAAPEWKALDGLPRSEDGWVVADSSHVWKTFRFEAKVPGAPPCTARVVVARRHLRIDAAGHPDSLAPAWRADSGLSASRLAWDGPLDLRKVADPAPDRVYRTARAEVPAHALPGLPDGRYTVRLHLAGPAPGRPAVPSLSVRLEGARVLEDWKPAASDTALAADVRDVQVTVADGNGLTLEAEPAAAGSLLAGWEVWDIGPTPIALLHPKGGEAFRVGDTLRVRWTTDGAITSAGIQFSPDSGKRWIPVTRRSSVNEGQPEWGDYPWVIPDSLDGTSLVCDACLLSVYDYFGTDRDRNDAVFRIGPAITGLKRRAAGAAGPVVDLAGGVIAIRVGGSGAWTAALEDASGRTLRRAGWSAPAAGRIGRAGLPRGVYHLSLQGPGIRLTRRLVLLD